jgi:sugar lactone lactonase YvrE
MRTIIRLTPILVKLGVGAAAGGALAVVSACGHNRTAERGGDTARTSAAGEVAGVSQQRIASTNGFQSPESIVYDSATDHYFVSNLNGPIGVKPGHGFVSRLTAEGTIDSLHFIVGGVKGVTLNAPMGLRIHDDTLWVADIDVLRAFDPTSGKPLRSISFAALHPHILNDFDWGGPDGAIYVTDMGMLPNPKGLPTPGAPMRILTVGRTGKPSVALTSSHLNTPDGIAWDANGKRFLIMPFGTNSDSVEMWTVGATGPRAVAAGKGMFDGVEVEHDGAIYLTSWTAQQVLQLRGDSLVTVATGFTAPSDVTLDTRRHRLGVTDFNANAVAVVAVVASTVASR